MKLRKHLRNKRLTSISQLGADRAIDIQFGQGETAFHLILEIYVSGNLIMTDHEYQILALLRVHNDQETKVVLVVRECVVVRCHPTVPWTGQI